MAEDRPFKVNRDQGIDNGNGLNDKRGIYSCRCGRAMFCKRPVVISTDHHIMVELQTVWVLDCLKCTGSYVVRRMKTGCISAFPSSNEAEKLIEEARKEEIDANFKRAPAAEAVELK